MPQGVNIPNEKRWLKDYISHPSFLKKLIANTDLSEDEAKEKVNIYLKNINSTGVEELPWSGGALNGYTNTNKKTGEKVVTFYDDTPRGTPVHEFTHASELDRLLNRFNELETKSNKVLRENESAAKKALGKDIEDYELWNAASARPFLRRSDKFSDLWTNDKRPKNINPGENNFNPAYNKGMVDYINGSEEVYPRVMKIRFQNNLQPGEVIDKKKMEYIKKTSGSDPLFEIYDDNQIMEFLNKLADKKTGVSNKVLDILKNKNKNSDIA